MWFSYSVMFYLFCVSFHLLIVPMAKSIFILKKVWKQDYIPTCLTVCLPTYSVFMNSAILRISRMMLPNVAIPACHMVSNFDRPSWPSWAFCEAAAWEEIWCRLGVAFWILMAASMSRSRMCKGLVPRWDGVGTSPFCGVRWMHPMAGLPWKSLASRTPKLGDNHTQQTCF